MKVSERLSLNRTVADELYRRFNIDEIVDFLTAFNLTFVPSQWQDGADYARQVLAKGTISILAEIVDDLGLGAFSETAVERQRPAMWTDGNRLRVFVSHLSSEKEKATRLRDCMKAVSMGAFVAHEDIEPTLEWQVQIERALASMELFVSLHTTDFSKSNWTQQEIGYAVAKGVKVIALRLEEDPTGFISKNQALSRGTKSAEQVVQEIKNLVLKDERLRERYQHCIDADIDDDVPF